MGQRYSSMDLGRISSNGHALNTKIFLQLKNKLKHYSSMDLGHINNGHDVNTKEALQLKT